MVQVVKNGRVGWIFGIYLSAERGGPTFHLPEEDEAWEHVLRELDGENQSQDDD